MLPGGHRVNSPFLRAVTPSPLPALRTVGMDPQEARDCFVALAVRAEPLPRVRLVRELYGVQRGMAAQSSPHLGDAADATSETLVMSRASGDLTTDEPTANTLSPGRWHHRRHRQCLLRGCRSPADLFAAKRHPRDDMGADPLRLRQARARDEPRVRRCASSWPSRNCARRPSSRSAIRVA